MSNKTPIYQWENDVILAAQRDAQTWRWVAIAGWIVAITSCVAVAGLTPLKTSEPILMKVDSRTGEIVQATALLNNEAAIKQLSQEEAVRQSLLVRYVVMKETFDRKDINARYNGVKLFSTGPVFDTYARQFEQGQKENVYTIYGDAIRQIKVQSVTFLTEDNSTAAIRFRVSYANDPAAKHKGGEYVALAKYKFTTEPTSLDARWENPLGFQVTEYRVDQATL